MRKVWFLDIMNGMLVEMLVKEYEWTPEELPKVYRRKSFMEKYLESAEIRMAKVSSAAFASTELRECVLK